MDIDATTISDEDAYIVMSAMIEEGEEAGYLLHQRLAGPELSIEPDSLRFDALLCEDVPF